MLNIKYEKFGNPVTERLYGFLARHLDDPEDIGQLENIEVQLGKHRRARAYRAAATRAMNKWKEAKKEFDKTYPPCE